MLVACKGIKSGYLSTRISFLSDISKFTTFYALVVSATIRVILTKISNGSGIAVQWNGRGGGGVRNAYSSQWPLTKACVLPIQFTPYDAISLALFFPNTVFNVLALLPWVHLYLYLYLSR